MNNITLYSISPTQSTQSIIQTSLQSNVSISNINYSNSNSMLLLLQSSSSVVNGVSCSSISLSRSSLIRIESSINTTLSNIIVDNMKSFRSWNTYAFYFANSNIDLIENVSLTNFRISIFITSTVISKINNFLADSFRGEILRLEYSTIKYASGLKFSNSGSKFTRNGVINNYSSNITIANSIFDSNQARYGAVFYYRCKVSAYCVCSIINSTFSNNVASFYGGAIYYDSLRPILTNVTFINNNAPYGSNIASYPVKIVNSDTMTSNLTFDNIASGQIYNQQFSLSIVDYDNQIIKSINSGSIIFGLISPNTKVLGGNSASIVNGTSVFNQIIFQGDPGTSNVKFSLSSSAIDGSVVKRQFGKSSIQDPVIVNFRLCEPGEYEENIECKVCQTGTYSVNWNSTTCDSCPTNARCLGGNTLYVDQGYWRSSINSSEIIKCIRQEACLGGFKPELEYPVECKEGYEGILCASCQIVNGKKYEKISDFQCSLCPDPVLNVIRIIGLMTLVVLFFIILIIVGIKKKTESQQSILLRIFTNYLQLLTAAMSFNLKFPSSLTQAFSPIKRIGSSSDVFFYLLIDL